MLLQPRVEILALQVLHHHIGRAVGQRGYIVMAIGQAAENVERPGSSTPTRHAILGMGGVGGLVGALLARAGDEVTAVLRPEALALFPTRLSLESPLGSFSVPVQRTTVVREPFDVLWIAVKATHLEAALASVEDANGIATIVPLLNGLDHLPLLRSRFGDEPVVPATISVESERVAPGRIVHRSPFLRLSVSTRGEARLLPVLEKLRRVGCSAQFISDEPTLMWSKLAFLAPFALTTSAAQTAIGDVVADPRHCGLCSGRHGRGSIFGRNRRLSILGKLSRGQSSSVDRFAPESHIGQRGYFDVRRYARLRGGNGSRRRPRQLHSDGLLRFLRRRRCETDMGVRKSRSCCRRSLERSPCVARCDDSEPHRT